MQPRIEIVQEPRSEDSDFVVRQILQFNSCQVGEGNYRGLEILLRDSENQIVGGLIGTTYWQWLFVDVLWLHEDFRGQGYGDALLLTAEQEAIDRGCQYAYLDTFSFQAPEFYQKRGYIVFGELPNFPEGHSRFFLKKELSRSTPGNLSPSR